jgi:protease-4
MIGVRPEVVKSGRLKDMASPFKPLGEEERQLMQKMIDEYHTRFVAVVRAGRPLPENATIGDLTDGRVFTGEQAKALGLVDRLGTLEDALDLARQRAGTPHARAVMYKRPYGYTGSIYATQDLPPAQMTGGVNISLPESSLTLPRGFYYLWEP